MEKKSKSRFIVKLCGMGLRGEQAKKIRETVCELLTLSGLAMHAIIDDVGSKSVICHSQNVLAPYIMIFDSDEKRLEKTGRLVKDALKGAFHHNDIMVYKFKTEEVL